MRDEHHINAIDLPGRSGRRRIVFDHRIDENNAAVTRINARGRVPDCDRIGDVEDELGRPLWRLAVTAHGCVDRPPRVAQPRRGRGADPGRRAGYERSRYSATSARCSRP